MKTVRHAWVHLMAAMLALCSGAVSGGDGDGNSKAESDTHHHAVIQAAPEVEKQRREAEQDAKKNLDQEAIAAIDETHKAIKAISENKTDEALTAIEHATGKINVLVARNPAEALIPVRLEVDVIDFAPSDMDAIKHRARMAERALEGKDYPTARLLLSGLTSEIRVRTWHLPLATFPTALKEAAKLLDQKRSKEARQELLMSLHTLVMIDRVTPLALVVAQSAIDEAQSLREKDKERAEKLLQTAREELKRAKELGYAGNDPEYLALNNSIVQLEKELKGKGDTGSAFSHLKERVAAFFKRQSQSQRR